MIASTYSYELLQGGTDTPCLTCRCRPKSPSRDPPPDRQSQRHAPAAGIAIPAYTGSVLVSYARSLIETMASTVPPNASHTDPCNTVRKNALFAGSDGGARHWAIVASLVATAKLNGVEPLAWLTDVLERMVSGRTKAHELERLLPWNWKAERLAAAVDA